MVWWVQSSLAKLKIDKYFIKHRIHKAKSLIYNEAVHLKYKNIDTEIYKLIQYKH